MVVVQGQADLLEVVGALDAPRRLAGRLDGRQQQGDQDRDDRDDDQQLDQREALTTLSRNPPSDGHPKDSHLDIMIFQIVIPSHERIVSLPEHGRQTLVLAVVHFSSHRSIMGQLGRRAAPIWAKASRFASQEEFTHRGLGVVVGARGQGEAIGVSDTDRARARFIAVATRYMVW